MEKVDIHSNYECKEGEEKYIQVNYRCWVDDNLALYPMESTGSIYKGWSMEDFIMEGLNDYGDTYKKVDVVEVYLGEMD